MLKTLLRPLPLVLLPLVVACGPAGDPGGEPEPGEPEPATFSLVQEEIFSPNCSAASCHSGAAPAGGISLEEGDAYASLSGTGSGGDYLVAGDPESSYLYQVVTEGDDGNGVRQMPPGVPLSDEKMEMIRSWIEDGAEEN